ncbi:hypothetical protein B4077_3130 [Bacillus cereus]|uniref:Uncharacterized protein n=1 Tax=Bacillus cereus TaxID=1396 RepID=A0A0G8ED26_BACCE|nr:hypothetical protein B4077_3130 [Bacillus cereus]
MYSFNKKTIFIYITIPKEGFKEYYFLKSALCIEVDTG